MWRKLLARLHPLLVAGAVLLLAHVPAVAAALPALDILRGPLGAILAGLALAVTLTGGGGDRLGPLLRLKVPAPLLFAVGFFLLATVGVHYTGRLRVSGDEPHYLLMAQSLWRDGDLELRDNKMRGEMEEYTPADIQPHWGAPRPDGRPFPAHGVGLPALLAPVYALGGRRACALLLVALGSGLALLARALALRVTGDEAVSKLAWIATLGPPASFYAFHVYTEMPSAVAVAGGLLLLLGFPRSLPAAVAAAALASTLPWLHVKLIPAAVALGVIGLVRLRGRARPAFVAVAALAAAGYMAFFQSVFGHPTPLALYGGHLPPRMDGAPLRAAAGLLLDRSFGLLPHAPVFLLALAAVPLALRRPLRETWPYALVLAAVLGPVLWWRMWWGGQCPPGRLLVPLVPLLAVLVAVRATRDDGPPRGLLRWRAALLSVGFAIVAYTTVDPGRLMLLNRRNRPTRLWTALSGEGDIGRYLPSLTHPDGAEIRVAALWLVALVVLLALDAASRPWARANQSFGGVGLPVALLLAVGVGVDYWARPSAPGALGAQPAGREGGRHAFAVVSLQLEDAVLDRASGPASDLQLPRELRDFGPASRQAGDDGHHPARGAPVEAEADPGRRLRGAPRCLVGLGPLASGRVDEARVGRTLRHGSRGPIGSSSARRSSPRHGRPEGSSRGPSLRRWRRARASRRVPG
jgi:hypothetical protein